MKKLIIVVLLSIVSLAVFAQSDYYYYKDQRIPLTINPKKVNVISVANGPQYAPSMQPGVLPNGLEVESVISDNPYNMCIIKENEGVNGLLNNYVIATINPNYNIVLPCYYYLDGSDFIITNNIYVKLTQSDQVAMLRSIASTYNLYIVCQDENMPLWFTLSITQQTPYNTVKIANMLYETGAFLAAEPEFFFGNNENISWDSNVSQQWGLYNSMNDSIDINASSAWNYATGRGVEVAIVDTGVEHTHYDLKENISSYCYDTNTRTNIHNIGGKVPHHGTLIAGVIAAERNNGRFIAGVAPNAEIIDISVHFGEGASGDKISDGIYKAVDNGAAILNFSWGGGNSERIKDAIDYAIDYGRNGKGCIVVKSSGNNNDSITFPGNHRPEILVVGAINNNGLKSSFSCYGNSLDVVAPGTSILSTHLNNSITIGTGTSMAAPHVAGVAALILELNPDLTGQQVRDIIEQSTIKVGLRENEGAYLNHSNRPNGTWNKYYGYGLVDALKAVQNTPRKQIEY